MLFRFKQKCVLRVARGIKEHKTDGVTNIRLNFLTRCIIKNAFFFDVTPCGSWFLEEPHSLISHKMAFFIVTASGNLKSYIILTRIGSVTEN
jgi:hypothetical protein